MSEQSQQADADGVASSGTPADSFSSNGSYPEGAVGIAEPAEQPDSAMAADEAPQVEMTAEPTDAVDGEPAAEAADATGSNAAEVAPDDGTAFLAELARAMQATAGIERKRLEEDTDRRREAHLEAIRARRESEAATMRELAAGDLKSIDEWAASERQRIDQEREARAAALQEDLDTSLAEHGAKIDREIEAVDAAIVAYRGEVDAYFSGLDAETDPVEIARHAGQRPTFPNLDAIAVAESATNEASTEQAAVGVMDPATPEDPAEAWAQWNALRASSSAAEAPVAADGASSEDGPAAPGETPTDESPPAPTSLLQTVRANRPFANLRGDRQKD